MAQILRQEQQINWLHDEESGKGHQMNMKRGDFM